MKLKKITAAVMAAALAMGAAANVYAVESWRDAYVTRLMKILSTEPSYTDIVLTDLNSDGTPEAWTIKNSADGGIGESITMKDNSIISINVPQNVIGMCLEDITVYSEDGSYHYVGREVGRYSNTIEYFLLEFDGETLTATATDRTIYSRLTAEPYKNVYGSGFVTDGLPSRAKLKEFIDSYTPAASTLNASVSQADVLVDGNKVSVSGITVNNNNYYKIRDIAMMLRSTDAKFDVTYNSELGAVEIITGEKYNIVGGELDTLDASVQPEAFANDSPLYIDGSEVHIQSYNVNDSNYYRIRDLADYLGFTVDWDDAAQAVMIVTK